MHTLSYAALRKSMGDRNTDLSRRRSWHKEVDVVSKQESNTGTPMYMKKSTSMDLAKQIKLKHGKE